MEYKYIVIYQPDDEFADNIVSESSDGSDSESPPRILSSNAEFYSSLREIGKHLGIDHTTVSKRLSNNTYTFLPKKGIWILKLI